MKTENDPPAAVELSSPPDLPGRQVTLRPPEDGAPISPEVARRLVHELRSHQIELELQNEELRRAYLKLNLARAKYFDLYDFAPVGYCTLNEQGLILEANLTLATLLGQNHSALLQQTFSLFIAQQDHDKFSRLRQQMLADPATESPFCEVQLRRSNGSLFMARLQSCPAKDDQGAPTLRLALTTFEDRSVYQNELREKEERLALATLSNGIGIWDWNLITQKMVWDESMFALYHIRREDFSDTEEAWRASLHPDDLARGDLEVTEAISGKKPFDTQFRVVWPNGEIHHIKAVAKVFRDDHGTPTRMLGTNWDITALKQAEAEHDRLTVHNQQLQKAESLGRMAGAIAHHFNNKLQAVMGNLDLALSDPARTAGTDAPLVAARKAAQQAAEISIQMLTYLGHSFDQTEVLDLSTVCRRSSSLLQAVLPTTSSLVTDLPSPGPRIKGSANQLKTLLTNLVTNAYEANGDNEGYIRLSVKTVAARDIPTVHRFPLGWQPTHATYACLEVADSGCGIANEDIPKLFDPFFSSKFTGRGLGLPMVLGIVKTHHGAITLRSRPSGGSVFHVFLPEAETTILPPPASLALFQESAEGATLLVIENETAVRLALALTLQHLRFKVLTADDGPAGVELFQQNQAAIDAVLCDVSMPKMNGWETLAALRQLAPEVPVIFCSGYHETLVMAGHHAEQPQAFLGKPYGVEQLQRTLHQVLAQRKK